MDKNNKLDTVILYTTGVCNLNCRYCGIDKNESLHFTDKALEESFKGDYYFNLIKKYLPHKNQLKRLETWGGEPFMHMERVYETLHNCINYYPFFKEMFSSTNFSYPTWNDKFFGLMSQFGQYDYRDFIYSLQLSCDGPEYINDRGRGNGTTKKCLENYKKFVEMLPTHLPSNVTLSIGIKPTLDINTYKELLNKDKIIEYYKFFEDNFIRPIAELNYSNIFISFPIPNMAVPTPATMEDGKNFAKLCKLCREIELEDKYFEFYKEITPFSTEIIQQDLTYNYDCHTCGTGTTMIGFLPNNIISACHEGFTEFANNYRELTAKSNRVNTTTTLLDNYLTENKFKLCVSEEEYKLFHYQMDLFTKEKTTSRLATSTLEICTLAMAGQIDNKYSDQVEALKAAIFMQSHTAFCIKDNIHICGSLTLTPLGMYKLLLNGAMDYIIHDEQIIKEKEKYENR